MPSPYLKRASSLATHKVKHLQAKIAHLCQAGFRVPSFKVSDKPLEHVIQEAKKAPAYQTPDAKAWLNRQEWKYLNALKDLKRGTAPAYLPHAEKYTHAMSICGENNGWKVNKHAAP